MIEDSSIAEAPEGASLRFPGGVPPVGPEILRPVGALPHCNEGQQAPEPAPVVDLEFAVPVADEKALERRLDDVLGIDFAGEELVELPPGEGDQPAGELL